MDHSERQMDQSKLFELYRELRAYVGWDDADVDRLAAIKPLLEKPKAIQRRSAWAHCKIHNISTEHSATLAIKTMALVHAQKRRDEITMHEIYPVFEFPIDLLEQAAILLNLIANKE